MLIVIQLIILAAVVAIILITLSLNTKSEGLGAAITGASEEGVYRWAEAEAALTQDFDPAAIDGLTVEAESMIGDVHGTPDYRAHLVGVMTRRAVASSI